MVQIVALTGALADTGEHRVPAVVHGDVVDQLHDHHGLADTSTSEEANLPALGIGGQEVDHLDAGHQDFLGLALLGEQRGGAVDGGLGVALDGALFVDGLADDVQDAAQGAGTHGDLQKEGKWVGDWKEAGQ